jgi:ABC-type nitrate/sulfonate/bicarbonate transport system permease component
MREGAGRLSLYAVGFASIFVLWHLAAVYFVSSVLFPPPWPVLLKAVQLARDGTLEENIAISLQRILLGFCGGAAIGILSASPSVRSNQSGGCSNPISSCSASFRRRR